MKRRVVLAIAQKDLREVVANRAVWLPAVIVPILLLVIPLFVSLVLPSLVPPERMNRMGPETFAKLLKVVPADLSQLVRGMPPTKAMGLMMAGFLFAPMFLIIPLMLSSIVGADSFVGEKERKTLEALLYTPATDAELLVGKTLAALVPALIISWGSFVLYAVAVNVLSWPMVGRVWFPIATWWPLMLWVAPAIATMGLGLTVLISSRVRTYMEANQLAGLPVLLIVGLMAGQISGAMVLGVGATWLLGLLLWLVDVALLTFAIRTFARTRMATQL